MIQEGFVLMAVGMSMVFVFLCLMIYAMHGLGKVVKMLDAAAARKQPPPPSPKKQDLSKEAAAIAAASQFSK